MCVSTHVSVWHKFVNSSHSSSSIFKLFSQLSLSAQFHSAYSVWQTEPTTLRLVFLLVWAVHTLRLRPHDGPGVRGVGLGAARHVAALLHDGCQRGPDNIDSQMRFPQRLVYSYFLAGWLSCLPVGGLERARASLPRLAGDSDLLRARRASESEGRRLKWGD